MKAETINNNIHRLLHFLNTPKEYWPTFSSDAEYSPQFLFNQYAAMLDYHGAPKDGLCRLFLPMEEYLELEEWIASFPTQVIYSHPDQNKIVENNPEQTEIVRPAGIGLIYDGNYWHIEKIIPQ